jgi:DNA-binding NtrC family response regulator
MEVPPLRDRKDDIPALVAHFVRQSNLRFHVPEHAIPHREMERAQRYDWPGNVRELQNVVERAVIVSRGAKLVFELPETRTPNSHTAPTSLPSTGSILTEREMREHERANLLAALRQANSRISGKDGAAELLGIHPATLTSRLKALGIDKRDYRPPQ